MLTLNDGRSELWQWDTGRTLAVDADCSQVHFSNKVFGRSIDVDVAGGVAIIPDILLQTDKDLNAWAFVGTAENGYTKISKTFKVNRRNKPADYVFTPTEQMTLQTIQSQIGDLSGLTTEAKDTLVDAINEAARSGGGGGGSTVELDTTLTQSGKAADAKAVGDALAELEAKEETDPTVPAWAKNPAKPSYTAAEVGAMAADASVVKTVNGTAPDASGNVTVETGGGSSGGGGETFTGQWEELVNHTVTADEATAVSITFTQENYPKINGHKTLLVEIEKPSRVKTPWIAVKAGSIEVLNPSDGTWDYLRGVATVHNGHWLQNSKFGTNANNIDLLSPGYMFKNSATLGDRNKAYVNYTSLVISSYMAFLEEGTTIKIYGGK